MEDGGKGFLDRAASETGEMTFVEMYFKTQAEASAVETKSKGWRVKLFLYNGLEAF
jgi:hypothetical protein